MSTDINSEKVGRSLQLTGFSLLYFGPSRTIRSPTILNKAAVRNDGAIIVVVILTVPTMSSSIMGDGTGYN